MSSPRPTVLIVGGFMTAPLNYWPMRRRLRRRDVERVDIASVWPPDWALAGLLGLGVVMAKARRAIARSYVAGGRRPIIVVAHSGGGIAVRLAMSPAPFHGRRGGVAEAVGCLVTLGTPHLLAGLDNRYHHAGHDAAAFLDQVAPGAYFAPRTAYLTIGSQQRLGIFSGLVGRTSDEIFSMVVGKDTRAMGDGIVPVGAVHLAGAEQMTFDDVVHGHIGTPWYGDEHVIDRWWPTAERLWREALAARRRGEPAIGPLAPEVTRAADDVAEEAALAGDPEAGDPDESAEVSARPVAAKSAADETPERHVATADVRGEPLSGC